MITEYGEITSLHIVDDDELARYLVKRCSSVVLKGITVHEHNSGESFLDFVDQAIAEGNAQPELQSALVTMDLRMPGIGGLEALKGVQARIDDGKLIARPFKCLVLTSSNNQTDKAVVEECHFVDRYVIKPLTVDLLIEIVQGPAS